MKNTKIIYNNVRTKNNRPVKEVILGPKRK